MSQAPASGPTSTRPPQRRLALSAALVAAAATSVFALSQLGQSSSAQAGLTTPAAAPAAPVASAKAAPVVVRIKNYAYDKANLTVKVGQTVTWINEDSAPHTVTVTSGPESFDSGTMAQGDEFSFTFTQAGVYEYYCAVHPDMVAKVTVVGDDAPAAPSGPSEPAEEPTDAPAEEPAGHSGHGGSTEPETAPEPEPSTEPTAGAPTPEECTGVRESLDVFMTHVEGGHLQTSPFQQVRELLDVDKYTQTHTILVQNMLEPILGAGNTSLDTFLVHLYGGHLETSPFGQVKELSDVDQYTLTHTILVENMVEPWLESNC
ncbi:plastocyanin/azurin family copper-binding protein [Nocardioides sp.]|uniref:cupredoxin domain-containing protein n=1 Tax=Nocardioides sp. TaxID=35761 RepID=UPI0035120FA9